MNSTRGCKLNGKNTHLRTVAAPGVKITSVESNSLYIGGIRTGRRERRQNLPPREMYSGTLKEFSGDVEIYICRVSRDPTQVPRINIPRNRRLTSSRTRAPVDSPGIQILEGNRNWNNPPFAFRFFLPLSSLPPRSHFARGLIDNYSPLNKVLRGAERTEERKEEEGARRRARSPLAIADGNLGRSAFRGAMCPKPALNILKFCEVGMY